MSVSLRTTSREVVIAIVKKTVEEIENAKLMLTNWRNRENWSLAIHTAFQIRNNHYNCLHRSQLQPFIITA